MATTKTTKKTTKKVEAKTESIVRKGALAYVGLYGLAYERAQFRADQLKNASGELFENLVKKGEKLEEQGLSLTKDVRGKATDFYNDGLSSVKNVVPFGKKDRVEDLESEIEALNKKIAALSKKASTPAKAVKTEKVTDTKAAYRDLRLILARAAPPLPHALFLCLTIAL